MSFGSMSFGCCDDSSCVFSRLSFVVSGGNVLTVLKRGNDKGDAVTGLVINLLAPASNGVLVSSSSMGSSAVSEVERGVKVVFRGPSGRFIKIAMGSSVTFNLSGRRVPHGSVVSRVSGCTGLISVRSCLSCGPSGLSKKRGREITVTKTLTVSASLVVFSSSASVLSPGNAGSVGRVVCGLGGSLGGAVVAVARGLSSTMVTSEMVMLGGNGVILSNGPGGMLGSGSILSTDKLGLLSYLSLVSSLGGGACGGGSGVSSTL